MHHEKINYEAVPEDEDTNCSPERANLRPSAKYARTRRVLAVSLLAILTGIVGATLGSFYPVTTLWRPRTAAQATDCGHTSAEAMAAGCVMEPLTYGWMAPECFYQEVSSLHNVFGDLAWYADKELTLPLTEEQLMRGEVLQIWTDDPRYHLWHCLFLMRKLYYAVEHEVEWIDSKTISSHHAYHCVGQLEELYHGENGTTLTDVNLGSYQCRKALWK